MPEALMRQNHLYDYIRFGSAVDLLFLDRQRRLPGLERQGAGQMAGQFAVCAATWLLTSVHSTSGTAAAFPASSHKCFLVAAWWAYVQQQHDMLRLGVFQKAACTAYKCCWRNSTLLVVLQWIIKMMTKAK